MDTLLIAEDDKNIQLLVAARLKSQYKVVCANDRQDALDIIESQRIDLLIADIMMRVWMVSVWFKPFARTTSADCEANFRILMNLKSLRSKSWDIKPRKQGERTMPGKKKKSNGKLTRWFVFQTVIVMISSVCIYATVYFVANYIVTAYLGES